MCLAAAATLLLAASPVVAQSQLATEAKQKLEQDRKRLQEAAERLRIDPSTDLATLAAETGYADHAHLTRDFRAVLGIAPTTYRADAAD